MKNYNLVEFIKRIEKEIPTYLAENWDNTGLQIARENRIVKKVLLSLDVSSTLLDYAKENNFDLIISHHPLIFTPLKSIISFNDTVAYLINQLILHNISLYVIHTNLDKLYFKALSEIFELQNIQPIQKEQQNPEIGLGSFGELQEECTLRELLIIIKEKLDIKKLRYTGNLNKKVKIVACCGGSCSSVINKELLEKKIDVLITADIKYHTAFAANNMGIAVVDAGHYHTEKIMLPTLKEKLINIFSDTEIIFEISKINTDPLNFF